MLPTKFWFIWPGGDLWWPCLLTNRDEMSNLYRGPSIDASYQVSVHLAKRFQRRRFLKNWPIRNKNCLWWPCLLMDRDKMSNLYKGPSIDASYQVSVHLAEGFQRKRLKCEKLTDNKWWQKLKDIYEINQVAQLTCHTVNIWQFFHTSLQMNFNAIPLSLFQRPKNSSIKTHPPAAYPVSAYGSLA